MRGLKSLDPEGRLATAASAKEGAVPDALLVSRLDLEQYLLELPPMPEERVRAALAFRLGALYPGAADTASIDFARNRGGGNSFLLFVMDDEALAAYRGAAGDLPLVSQSLLAADMAPRGEWSCVFWTAAWASLDRFEDGRLTESIVIVRAGEPMRDWSNLMRKRTAAGHGDATVLVSDDASADSAFLEALGSEGGCASLSVLPLAAVLPRVRLSASTVFPIRPRSRRRRRFALAALSCLDALLALALAYRYSGALEEEEAALKARYLSMQMRNGAALRLSEETDAKEKKYDSLIAGDPPDMYAVIAGIATRSGEGTRILSLVLEGGAFEMEAEGRDALAALARLEETEGLKGIKLRQSVPMRGGIERFSISGSYGNDRL